MANPCRSFLSVAHSSNFGAATAGPGNQHDYRAYYPFKHGAAKLSAHLQSPSSQQQHATYLRLSDPALKALSEKQYGAEAAKLIQIGLPQNRKRPRGGNRGAWPAMPYYARYRTNAQVIRRCAIFRLTLPARQDRHRAAGVSRKCRRDLGTRRSWRPAIQSQASACPHGRRTQIIWPLNRQDQNLARGRRRCGWRHTQFHPAQSRERRRDPRRVDRPARHRPMDVRHLSDVRITPGRRVCGWRSGVASRGSAAFQARRAPGTGRTPQDRGALAAMARGGRKASVGRICARTTRAKSGTQKKTGSNSLIFQDSRAFGEQKPLALHISDMRG